MATKIHQEVKVRQKKIPQGSVKCNVCGGKGYHKSPNHSNKKQA